MIDIRTHIKDKEKFNSFDIEERINYEMNEAMIECRSYSQLDPLQDIIDNITFADMLINKIPFKNKNQTMLEPAVGRGTYAFRYWHRLFNIDLKEIIQDPIKRDKHIRSNMWLVDNNSFFTNKLSKFFPNVITSNFLELKIEKINETSQLAFHINNKKYNMNFDVVLMNAPYKINNDKNYYIKFNKICSEILKEDGWAGIIMPNRFLVHTSKASKSIKNWLDVKQVYPSVNYFFPGIGTSIGAVIGSKKHNPNTKDIDYVFLPDNKVIKWNLNKPMPIMNTSIESAKIVDKVFSSTLSKITYSNIKPTGAYLSVNRPYCRYRSTTPRGGEKTLVCLVNEENISGDYFPMPDKKTAEVNAWAWSRSTLGRYVIYCFANAVFSNSSPLHQGLLPILPNTLEKSDKSINSFFGISDNEYSYMKKIII